MRSLAPALVVFLAACSQDTTISTRLESPPQVAIQAPGDSETFTEADAIEFLGLVSDGNGVKDIVSLSWSSDAAGELATLAEAPLDAEGYSRFATTLPAGRHAITLVAVDSTDKRAQTSISVTVTEIDTSPFAEINAPGAFDRVRFGTDISLIGGASDPNQPPDTLSAVWTWEPAAGGAATEIAAGSPSSTGTSLATWSGAPVGDHRIRFIVTDREGQQAQAQVVIEVSDPNEADADGDGWTVNAGDCDDNDPNVNPGADEACNGVDDDCNGVVDDKDLDLDGFIDEDCDQYFGPAPVTDCDDTDPRTNPDAPEVLNGRDNDCNGIPDDGLSTFDNDGDCYCSAANCTGSINPACVDVLPGDCDDTDPDLNLDDLDGDGYSTCTGDCDDTDPALSGADNDNDGVSTCQGDCDDNNALLNPFDNDRDGFSTCQGDCNDSDPQLTPVDNDGDGASSCQGDCNDNDPALNLRDLDADGYTTCDGDCDDNDATLNLDDLDADGWSTCAGDCDDDNPLLTPFDADGDGASSCQGDCNDNNAALNLRDLDRDGYSTCDGDCDDNNASLNLDDNDNDGFSTCTNDCNDNDAALNPADVDRDGWSTCQGDCNDNNAQIYPGRPEVPYDGIDQDCDGQDLTDVDGDGYDAIVAGGTDCNDNNPLINPGRPEVCNGFDDDCDGQEDEQNATGCTTYYLDNDDDGYGTSSSRCYCEPTGNYRATVAGDCYDNNALARPGQTQFFLNHRGDGSWDYNCDNVQAKIDNRSATYSCNLCGFANTNCCWDSGFVGGPPACGQSREYNTGCFWVPTIGPCNPLDGAGVIVQQTCR